VIAHGAVNSTAPIDPECQSLSFILRGFRGQPRNAAGTCAFLCCTPPRSLHRPGAVFGECAFPFRLELNGKADTITLPGGRFIFTSPGLKATLTNLNTPTKSVTLNITGASGAPQELMQEPQTLGTKLSGHGADTRDVAARTVEARHQA
jgi:hypothetical protein